MRPLILAIDADKRQSTQLSNLVRTQLEAELVLRPSAAEALAALRGRVPDLVLTSSLISLRDDAALATHLRELGAAAAHVQTVTIPLLGGTAKKHSRGGVLAALRREKPQATVTDACAPDLFAEQIRQYLATAEEQKATATLHAAQDLLLGPSAVAETQPVQAIEPAQTTVSDQLVNAPHEAPDESIPAPVAFQVDQVPPTVRTDAELLSASPVSIPDPVLSVEWPEPPGAALPEPLFAEPAPVPGLLAPASSPAFESLDSAPAFESTADVEPATALETPVAFESTGAIASTEARTSTGSGEFAGSFEWTAPSAIEADVLIPEEPAALPLSQLLQLVSDWQAPQADAVISAPAADAPSAGPAPVEVGEWSVEEMTAAPAGPIVDPEDELEPELAFAQRSIEAELTMSSDTGAVTGGGRSDDEPLAAPARAAATNIASDWQEQPAAPPTSAPDDLYVDQAAADALDELSRMAPPPPTTGDAIPAEVPVPVVEMHTFQSLDSIASELAAGGRAPAAFESLDDLASMFAAKPTPPATAARAAEAESLDIGGSRGGRSSFESLFAEPPAAARPTSRPSPLAVPGVDASLFAGPTPAVEPVEPRPEPPVLGAPATTAEPVLDVRTPRAVAPARPEAIAPREPAVPVSAEPAVAKPLAIEPAVARPEPVQSARIQSARVESARVESVPVESVPLELAPAIRSLLDEEISIDVDAVDVVAAAPSMESAPAPVAPAPPPALEPPAPPAAEAGAESHFAFTFVDTLGDTWSDFEVPTVESVAEDLGLPEQPLVDPATLAQHAPPARAAAATSAPGTPATPVLDDEALSLIGDAARKASLDAFVIEEFERGLPAKQNRKVKAKKVHAGATQVKAGDKKTRPVQDEWGMFDPDQCGFAALEDEESVEPRPRDGTRVRVISY